MTENVANVAIISAYNDMLSAHQPYKLTPDLIKETIAQDGATAQFAGGVPAMCDGVTQGQPGMELSLFSRDVIAMSTAVALSHNMFDAALCLGICDKIVPGLLIGALRFGHLPVVFVPAGPMPSGLPNKEKARIRQLYAEGKVDRPTLLEAEVGSYHGPGTCTFYGTANSNQMLMEIMGLQLPGSSFVNPNTPLRDALSREAAKQVLKLTHDGEDYRPIGHVVDEKAIINGVVGLLATGGSTNLTIHLVAIARAAGIQLTWDDFAELSEITPLLTRIYPSGEADINHFHAAGGMSFLVRALLDAGLLHEDVLTVAPGRGLRSYIQEPSFKANHLVWIDGADCSLDETVVRSAARPFAEDGGLKLLDGNLGRAVIKTSAVDERHHVVEAAALVFNDQQEVLDAFERGHLSRDFIAVLRFQGPKANGMPELHKLTPVFSVLQDRGHKVALVTDGRMSGASGKVPAAIHVTPEAEMGGPLAKVQSGDVICLDAIKGTLNITSHVSDWETRIPITRHVPGVGTGRELFSQMRESVDSADRGAMSFTGLA
jgi:phosphogluconate dehydratase